MVFLKDFFEKGNLKKIKNPQRTKKHAKLPSMQRVNGERIMVNYAVFLWLYAGLCNCTVVSYHCLFISSFFGTSGRLCFSWASSFTLEPPNNKTYNKTCVTSKDSDQPVHPPITERFSFVPVWISRRLQKAHAISKDFDQTAWMRRLIWVFAGHTGLVGFVMCWLIFIWQNTCMHIALTFRIKSYSTPCKKLSRNIILFPQDFVLDPDQFH